MRTLIVHRTAVWLPAYAFTSHTSLRSGRTLRICLSRRHLTKMKLTPVQQLRRSASGTTDLDPILRPHEVAPMPSEQTGHWQSVASLLCMVAVVLACTALAVLH